LEEGHSDRNISTITLPNKVIIQTMFLFISLLASNLIKNKNTVYANKENVSCLRTYIVCVSIVLTSCN